MADDSDLVNHQEKHKGEKSIGTAEGGNHDSDGSEDEDLGVAVLKRLWEYQRGQKKTHDLLNKLVGQLTMMNLNPINISVALATEIQ